MTDWPVTLPQVPLRAGYSRVERNTVITSQVGYGPAKLRNRTTSVMYDLVCPFQIDGTQKATLETFYEDNRTLPWDWAWPDTSVSYRFKSPPIFKEITCDVWAVQLQLEQLP